MSAIQETPQAALLAPYRVIELASTRTAMCGQILADLGADVVAVEPPGGSPLRRMGPFLADDPGIERGLPWLSFNRGKRSVTLNLASQDGRALLHDLLSTAHFFITGLQPVESRALGIDPETLTNRYPRLITTSVTPYGRCGPEADWQGGDLVELAASTALKTWGDADRPPVRFSFPQAYLHAGAEAAVGTLVAHLERERSGLGQHVDASSQVACVFLVQSHVLEQQWGDAGFPRAGGGMQFADVQIRFSYPCKDGFIAGGLFFGTAHGPKSRKLMELVYEEGFCDAATRDKDWVSYMQLLRDGNEPLSELQRVQDCVATFFLSHTKEELARLGEERGLLLAPISVPSDIYALEQLQMREFWSRIEHPGPSARLLHPGAFAKFSATPLNPGRPAPLLGEHNREVFCGELGLTAGELELLFSVGAI